jgi:fumarate reductase subunit C
MDQEMSRRPFVRPVSASEWVFRHPRYMRYMVREFSCLFIGGWTLLMVWGLMQLSEGPAAWPSAPG